MPFLFEGSSPIKIPGVNAPRPEANTEQRDASSSLGLLLGSERLNVHHLDFGVYATDEFPVFQAPGIHPPSVVGRILVARDCMLYAPNQEGTPGDITVQDDLRTHQLAGIRIPGDADVLVIAQRIRSTSGFAVTAALAPEDLTQVPATALVDLKVRYGAY